MINLTSYTKAFSTTDGTYIFDIFDKFLTINEIYALFKKVPENSKITFIECKIDTDTKAIKEGVFKKMRYKRCTFYCPTKKNDSLIKQTTKDSVLINKNYTEWIIDTSGRNISDLPVEIISRLKLRNINLSNVELPKNKDFFQLIRDQSAKRVKFPTLDLRHYNLFQVTFKGCKFTEETILPENFFRILNQRKLTDCTLPPLDIYSDTLDGCTLEYVTFNKNTIFHKNKNLFQSANLIFGCHFPSNDYTAYDFNNCNIDYCTFASKSKMPKDKSIIKKIISNQYPKRWIQENIVYLDTSMVDIEELLIKFTDILSIEQMYLLNSTHHIER